MTELRKTILELIAKNKTGAAIERLLIGLENTNNLKIKSHATLLSSRYRSLRDRSTRGVLSHQEIALEETKLNNDILELVQNLEQPNASVTPNTSSNITTNKNTGLKPLIGIIGFLVLAMVGYFGWTQMNGNNSNGKSNTTQKANVTSKEDTTPKTNVTPKENTPLKKPATTVTKIPTPTKAAPIEKVLLPRKFRIQIKNLRLNNIDDGSSPSAEVYGRIQIGLGKKGDKPKAEIIFNRRAEQHLEMREGQNYPSDKENVYLDFEVPPTGKTYPLDDYEFFINAKLKEQDDTSGDDDMGTKRITKSFSSLSNKSSEAFVLKLRSDEGIFLVSTLISEVK